MTRAETSGIESIGEEISEKPDSTTVVFSSFHSFTLMIVAESLQSWISRHSISSIARFGC